MPQHEQKLICVFSFNLLPDLHKRSVIEKVLCCWFEWVAVGVIVRHRITKLETILGVFDGNWNGSLVWDAGEGSFESTNFNAKYYLNLIIDISKLKTTFFILGELTQHKTFFCRS